MGTGGWCSGKFPDLTLSARGAGPGTECPQSGERPGALPRQRAHLAKPRGPSARHPAISSREGTRPGRGRQKLSQRSVSVSATARDPPRHVTGEGQAGQRQPCGPSGPSGETKLGPHGDGTAEREALSQPMAGNGAGFSRAEVSRGPCPGGAHSRQDKVPPLSPSA